MGLVPLRPAVKYFIILLLLGLWSRGFSLLLWLVKYLMRNAFSVEFFPHIFKLLTIDNLIVNSIHVIKSYKENVELNPAAHIENRYAVEL